VKRSVESAALASVQNIWFWQWSCWLFGFGGGVATIGAAASFSLIRSTYDLSYGPECVKIRGSASHVPMRLVWLQLDATSIPAADRIMAENYLFACGH